MDNTIIQQGTFTSTGSNVVLTVRSDIDWMTVYNLTQGAAAQTTAVGVKYYWQRGMATGGKWTTFKSNAANAANLEQYIESNGFTLLNSSLQAPGVLNTTITAISNAAIPVVTNTGTNGLAAGDIVRFSSVTGGRQLAGLDFTVGNNTLTTTTFSIDYMAQIVAATTGSWRKIEFNPIFYPRRRFITKITKAAEAVVTLSVTHQYKVGQKIRLVVPAAYGMVEMNGLSATILAIDTDVDSGNTITINVDSSAFTTFAFPLTSNNAFSPAEVVPMGEDTAIALELGADILSDATVNNAFLGMELAAGESCPAGEADDELMWVAGKSFSDEPGFYTLS